LAQFTSIEGSGSNHLAYYDLTNMMIYVSFASPTGSPGPENGFERQFTSLDAGALFNVKPPVM